MSLVWTMVLGLAWGQDPGTRLSARHALDDQLLEEAMTGDLQAAIETYRSLSINLPEGPSRAAALYWLGRTHYLLGNHEDARQALRAGIATGYERDRCAELLGRIELEKSAVTQLPVRWDFSEPDHGLIHPFSAQQRGSIRIEQLDGNPALAWTTQVDARSPDRLELGLRSDKIHGFRFDVRPMDVDVYLRLTLIDRYGRTWRLEDPKSDVSHTQDFWLPKGRSIAVGIPIERWVGPDGTRPSPDELDRLVIEDVTAIHSFSVGQSTVYLDNVEVY